MLQKLVHRFEKARKRAIAGSKRAVATLDEPLLVRSGEASLPLILARKEPLPRLAPRTYPKTKFGAGKVREPFLR
jgi:hypothetical protein